ncbi:sigma-54-dependent Fis family transcriptional regulator [Cytobacillus purgationiresistens]|uniref:Transcriptional regulator with PAS, ATPase and Fis domain n=1 Tax=Cytobacillus purgationiresistens TaxID=863449 RepID=A0ABU0AGH3_9BACI|nr:sigma-54-dependent Fis family transcriptional regulator [Cytobacillus purgationiresistens]MDQ0270347.1 transcriptional regulator with PAS, ATPase and Fis domain [Cytobacillus purgationiresistens]
MLIKNSFTQTVSNYMNRHVPKLTDQHTILDAVKIFRKDKIWILPVMDEQNLFVGALTPSAIFKALSENASIDEPILPYIIKNTITVYETDDLTEVRSFLLEKQVGQAVVLSADNRVSGVLDTKNIIQAYKTRSDTYGYSLESLFQHMQTGILALDYKGRILVANHAAESMCNIKRDYSIGHHFSEIFPDLIEFKSDNPQMTDIPLQRITIDHKKLLVKYKSLSRESKYWGGIILISDLTDYEEIAKELEITKRLERTLQTVLNTTNDAYIVIDQTGKIDMINEAAMDFTKKPKQQLLGRSVKLAIPEIHLEEALNDDFQGEKLEAMIIEKRKCLVQKTPIFKDHQRVGTIAKIIYKDLNKWKSVIKTLTDLEKEVSFYRGELSLIGGTPFDLDDIITQDPELKKLKHFARQSASGFSNVLLLGESGTGKELFARGIHNASHRTGKFIKVNCAAIPEELWESEFFGYADGAFTGAKKGGKPGKFELAHNGTLFLDEIGDMPLLMQVKLLRVLQEKEFERVGGNETINVNVRIIAATNKNLTEMVAKNEFREDLFYRLNVIVLNIPPLRERAHDIPLLAKSITKKLCHLMGLGNVHLSKTVLMALSMYQWPGNVRELENAVERALNAIESDVLEIEHLPEYIQKQKINQSSEPPALKKTNVEQVSISDFYKLNMDNAEKDTITFALNQTNGNRTAAAKLLGISRSQFYKKLRKLDIL